MHAPGRAERVSFSGNAFGGSTESPIVRGVASSALRLRRSTRPVWKCSVFFGAGETRRSQIERAGRPVLVALRVAMSGPGGEAGRPGRLHQSLQSCVVALNGDSRPQRRGLAVPEAERCSCASAASVGGIDRRRPSAAPLPSAPGEAVKVSLSDCLACSGCVTSAETVLLEAQSAEAFKRALREASEPAGADASASSSAAKPHGVRSAPSWSPSRRSPARPRRGRGPGRAGSAEAPAGSSSPSAPRPSAPP